MEPPGHLDLILTFLRGVGLPVAEASLKDDETFLPGLALRNGGLAYDSERLLHHGDLLHEAGHLAVLPPEIRAKAGAEDLMDEPVTEVAAIAWSVAALLHLGLPFEAVFHAEGYRGQARALAMAYALGVYPGLPGLEAAGLAVGPQRAAELGVAPYPAMIRWLQA